MITNYFKKHRNPGWIELFFDLAYVVLLGRMAHILFHTHHGELDSMAVVSFLWIFSVQFLVWMLFTVYINIYGNDSQSQNGFAFLLMTCLISTAILMTDLVSNAKYIALSLAVMSLIISFMYSISKDRVPSNRKYAIYKSKSLFTLGIASIPVLFMEPLTIIIYVFVIYSLEHLMDEIFLNKVGSAKPDGEHFVERIGIFMILLFGESFVTLVDNIPKEIGIYNLYPVFMILVILFGLWINYYTFNEKLTKANYTRYSQILFTNYLVMFAMTIFPAIVYHGIHQELAIDTFKLIIIVFSIFFFGGNGFSYIKIPEHTRWGSITYGTLPTLIISIILYFVNSYILALITLLLMVALTATVMINSILKLKKD